MTLGRKIKLGLYIVALGWAISYWYSVNYPKQVEPKTIPVVIPPKPAIDSLHLKEALNYCDSLGYDKECAILINLGPHSGNYRLFTFNLETGDTLVKGLVAHGHCKKSDGRLAEFSNEIGCNCSSVGHYRVGGKYNGSFGTSYKLIGKDPSNSNALNRFVVLHSHSCIPDEAQDNDICRSEGCPTVSPDVIEELIPLLDHAKKPVLLWIFGPSERPEPEIESEDDLQKQFELEFYNLTS